MYMYLYVLYVCMYVYIYIYIYRYILNLAVPGCRGVGAAKRSPGVPDDSDSARCCLCAYV